MTNIVNNLKKMFVSAEKTTESNNNIIVFEILDNGTVKTQLKLNSSTKKSAENFGAFLFEVTSGLISQHIIDVMLGLAKDYPEYNEMIKHSILVWLSNIKDDQSEIVGNDEPIVSPTKFSSHS